MVQYRYGSEGRDDYLDIRGPNSGDLTLGHSLHGIHSLHSLRGLHGLPHELHEDGTRRHLRSGQQPHGELQPPLLAIRPPLPDAHKVSRPRSLRHQEVGQAVQLRAAMTGLVAVAAAW